MEGIAVRGTMFSVLDLEGLAGPHAAEFEGKKTFGVLFEEGCHAVTEGGMPCRSMQIPFTGRPLMPGTSGFWKSIHMYVRKAE